MDQVLLGERELDVMGVLWDVGSGTVAEVRDALSEARGVGLVVLTILRNLETKGFVRHEIEGKAHRYFPRVAQRNARRSAVARLIERLFQGSPEQLLAQLVEDRALTEDDLQRVRRRLSTDKTGGDS